jgi:hypothetical protein
MLRVRGKRGPSIPAVLLALHLLLPPALLAAEDPLAYQDRGNRSEGHRRIEISAPSFEVLSFVRGPSRLTRQGDGSLPMAFFLPMKSVVHITAQELVPITRYRMEVKRTEWDGGWNTFAPWPAAQVIEPLGVQLANIGVLARMRTDSLGSGELVALSLSPDRAPAPTYELQFRAKYDVETASYQLETGASRVVRSGVVTDIIGGAPAAIRFDLSRLPEGPYRLSIDCAYRGRSGGPQRVFTFHHKP